MHTHIKSRQDFNLAIFIETEAVLSEKENTITIAKWTSEDNIQLPNLVNLIIERLSLDLKSQPEIDAMIRGYVRTHPNWYVARGAKGGAMPFSVFQKKQGAKDALETAKKTVLEQINLKNKAIKMAAKVAIVEVEHLESFQETSASDVSEEDSSYEEDLTI